MTAQETNLTMSTEAALASLWTMPFSLVRMVHDFEVDAMHSWARMFWCYDHPHRHEPPSQLEIPDPIAEAPEQDLFA